VYDPGGSHQQAAAVTPAQGVLRTSQAGRTAYASPMAAPRFDIMPLSAQFLLHDQAQIAFIINY